MWTKTVNSCCSQYVNTPEPYCPVCFSQLAEYRREREHAEHFQLGLHELEPRKRQLVERGALPPEEAGLHRPLVRGALSRNPARRAVFKLLGIYVPEKQAQAILRSIHEYKWLTAERAGEDIWRKRAPRSPFAAAAKEWASQYLNDFLRWAQQRQAA